EGCHEWTYKLHYDRPSRAAMLKNALGNSVTLMPEYYPPGTTLSGTPPVPTYGGAQSDWPDPTTQNPKWDWKTTTDGSVFGALPWDHDCDGVIQACLPGESPGLTYSVKTDQANLQNEWIWTLSMGYDRFNGIIYRPDPGMPFRAYNEHVDVSGGSVPGIS